MESKEPKTDSTAQTTQTTQTSPTAKTTQTTQTSPKAETSPRAERSPKAERSLRQKMHDKVLKYVEQAKSYADKEKQERARSVLPTSLLRGDDINDTSLPDLLTNLLKWFKFDFFKWTDSPFCEKCSTKASQNEGYVKPLEEELCYGAERVESWRCTSCDSILRFPRYSDPCRLLETRHGRCGEWANCFTLLLAALGIQVRLVVDWTDHVWTEVWFSNKWHHCDPCEACFDAPLMYESGWGKKLSYIIAFSPWEVVDVAPRYTRNWSQVLTRRTACSENELAETLEALDLLTRSKSGLETPEWREDEKAELLSMRDSIRNDVSEAELCGRTSGSLAWRAERGECGFQLHPVVQEADDSLLIITNPKVSSDGATKLEAQLLCGAKVTKLGYTQCFDFRGSSAALELTMDTPSDAFLSDQGFTIEAWIFVKSEELHPEAFRNPVLSKHGTASGWELRLCQKGGVVFLITIDRQHIELTSNGESAWPASWIHVAASFDGEKLRVYVSKELIGEVVAPAGNRSTFEGPLCLARNPAWTDRSASIAVHSARVSGRSRDPTTFLPAPLADGSSFL